MTELGLREPPGREPSSTQIDIAKRTFDHSDRPTLLIEYTIVAILAAAIGIAVVLEAVFL